MDNFIDILHNKLIQELLFLINLLYSIDIYYIISNDRLCRLNKIIQIKLLTLFCYGLIYHYLSRRAIYKII